MSTVDNCSNRSGKSRLRNFSTKGEKANISGFVTLMLCTANNQICHNSTETTLKHVWVKGYGCVPEIILIKDWEVLDFKPNLSVSVLADMMNDTYIQKRSASRKGEWVVEDKVFSCLDSGDVQNQRQRQNSDCIMMLCHADLWILYKSGKFKFIVRH